MEAWGPSEARGCRGSQEEGSGRKRSCSHHLLQLMTRGGKGAQAREEGGRGGGEGGLEGRKGKGWVG